MIREDHLSWLLVSIVTGSENALRVRVWRELRKLGAVYLHGAVCLLPNRPEVEPAVRTLAGRVRANGGRARVLQVHLTDPADEAAIIAEQVAERDREYLEVVDRTGPFVDEIEQESARGNLTYTEVEESEADLDRFERWFASIAARDYFVAPARAEAEAALERCRTLLAKFQDAAFAAETGTAVAMPHAPAVLRIIGDET